MPRHIYSTVSLIVNKLFGCGNFIRSGSALSRYRYLPVTTYQLKFIMNIKQIQIFGCYGTYEGEYHLLGVEFTS